ncbi:RNA-dependent DNA polymerase [Phytophthora cinnamomi]|uniref:RNA-dependent DNA polymerase n=1 Tax=Phytophthora cinnamomi TaxID=4785 RepID=UPI003559C57A|nr:RNA-dependent DNA polymerase [Phytophthora cinnamomi]
MRGGASDEAGIGLGDSSEASALEGVGNDAVVDVHMKAKQTTPVPYRPVLLGLVERFHRSWKDVVALYVAEAQNDWDQWLLCAAYAYNGARHTSTGFSPNELMMGRRLRAPNELLRVSGVRQVGEFAEYQRRLVANLARATEAARKALEKDQRRREKFYNRRVRQRREFSPGDLVWVLRPSRGKGITKLAHQWVGPAKVVQDAGFDNMEVVRDDTGEHLVKHSSFLAASSCPSDSLGAIAERILAELAEEDDEAETGSRGDGRLDQNLKLLALSETQWVKRETVVALEEAPIPVNGQKVPLDKMNDWWWQIRLPRWNRRTRE